MSESNNTAETVVYELKAVDAAGGCGYRAHNAIRAAIDHIESQANRIANLQEELRVAGLEYAQKDATLGAALKMIERLKQAPEPDTRRGVLVDALQSWHDKCFMADGPDGNQLKPLEAQLIRRAIYMLSTPPEPRGRDLLAELRDIILYDRGRLAEAGLTADQTNAVFGELDALVARAAPETRDIQPLEVLLQPESTEPVEVMSDGSVRKIDSRDELLVELRGVIASKACKSGTCCAAERKLIARVDDATLGVAWWNHITEAERAKWLDRAGSAVPADSWAAFKRAPETTASNRVLCASKLCLEFTEPGSDYCRRHSPVCLASVDNKHAPLNGECVRCGKQVSRREHPND